MIHVPGTGGVNNSVQVGFGAIALTRPTRTSAATECTGGRNVMYNDSLQLTGSRIRRSTDLPLIPTRPAGAVPSVERMEHGECLVRSRPRAHEPPRAPVPSALRGAAVPPPPLLEEEVVAAEGNANSRPHGHVETTCTRRRVQTCVARADDGVCDGRQRHIMHGSHTGRRREEIAALQSLLAVRRGSVSSTSTPRSQLHMDEAMHVRTSFGHGQGAPPTVWTGWSSCSMFRSARSP